MAAVTKAVNTAPRPRSIWTDVNKKEFEKHVDQLKNVQRYNRQPCVCDDEYEPSGHRTHDQLPFLVEKELADGFATVAACDHDVKFVTTACIEPLTEPSGLTVRLAANGGIEKRVEDAFHELFDVLARCSSRGEAQP